MDLSPEDHDERPVTGKAKGVPTDGFHRRLSASALGPWEEPLLLFPPGSERATFIQQQCL